MDKELQGKLVEILTSIQSGVGEAKDFALSQLPDIAQSYIAYGRISSAITCALLLAIALAAGATFLWNMRNFVRDTDFNCIKSRAGSQVIVWVMSGLTFFVSAPLFIVSINSALLVWLAPKVWLLKELAHLVK
jgi:hypothetical protein